MRQINILNQSTKITAAQLSVAVGALQAQASAHFAPAYGLDCFLKAFQGSPTKAQTLAGETIYLLDHSDQAGALGYHLEDRGTPTGYVFVVDSVADVGNWESCASHELLEQLADPQIDLCVPVVLSRAFGRDAGKFALTSYECADPVENDTYAIAVRDAGGIVHQVPMSNFVLPAWFSGEAGPFDYLKRLSAPLTLTKGGYVSYSLTSGATWTDVAARKKHGYSRHTRRRVKATKRRASAGLGVTPTTFPFVPVQELLS